ncbi:MAG: prephenate dehydrogenase [Chitinophagales bacterium]|nr:prephenate dehydrogenase [Chitinophagales bacterium]
MIIAVIGLGLIGGSMALDLRQRGFAQTIVGVDNNPIHTLKALELGIVDVVLPLNRAVAHADLVIVAIPVQQIIAILPDILSLIPPHAIVLDLGSAKEAIVESIREHPLRKRFVAAHPMAGTEYSGPEAALSGLFDQKVAIICNEHESAPDAVQIVEQLFATLNMPLRRMEANEHDMHVAYISHISHISSFVLATAVLEKEKSVNTIFDLASGGFASTVRLAKSSPQMWRPIFEQNSHYVLEVLDTYLSHLQHWRQLIADQQFDTIEKMMTRANEIKRVLDR